MSCAGPLDLGDLRPRESRSPGGEDEWSAMIDYITEPLGDHLSWTAMTADVPLRAASR